MNTRLKSISFRVVVCGVLIGMLFAWPQLLHAADHDILIHGVLHTPEGTPIDGGKIIARSGEQEAEGLSGSDGRFKLKLDENFSFPLEVRASAPGFEEIVIDVRHEDRLLDIALSPTGNFSGSLEISGSRAESGKTPVPMSLIEREEIEEKNWGQDVPLLLQGTPGFYAYNDNGNGLGYSYFYLRGFDMRRTSVSLNGVPLNDATSHGVYFVDLNSFLSTTDEIEVQRGVGRSLYGGSAIGGSVDFRTAAPSSEQDLKIDFMAGAFNTTRSEIRFNTGLIDDEWAASFRYSKTSSDGYRDLSWLEAWNYFLDLDHYSEKATTRLILFGGPERTHLAYEGITRARLRGEITGNRRRDRRYNPLSYPGEIDDFFQPHYQLIDTRQIGKNIVLQNTLYYFEGEGYYKQYKEDRWMPEYGLEPFPGPDGNLIENTDLIRKREVDESDLGWIPGIEWKHGGRGKLQAGIALRYHTSHHLGTVIWAQHYPPTAEPDHAYYDYRLIKTSLQPYVEENWNFNSRLSLLAGLSWTSHRYHLSHDEIRNKNFSRSFNYFLPRLGLNFRASEHLSVYGSISRGAREPAFRDIYDPQDYWFGPDPLNLDPEKLTDYELGAEVRRGTVSAKLNLFYLDFNNEIVWAGGVDSDGLPTTANGAQTTHRGAEFEAGWFPAERFGVRLTASYNHATFDHFIEYDWDGNEIDHAGNRIAGAPEFMASLQLNGGWGPVDVLLSINEVGKFYLDNSEDERKNPEIRDDPDYIHKTNPSYRNVDLSLKIDLGRGASLIGAEKADLNIRINNLFDTLYTSYGYVWGPEPTWIPASTRGLYAGLSLDW